VVLVFFSNDETERVFNSQILVHSANLFQSHEELVCTCLMKIWKGFGLSLNFHPFLYADILMIYSYFPLQILYILYYDYFFNAFGM